MKQPINCHDCSKKIEIENKFYNPKGFRICNLCNEARKEI